MRQNLKVRSGNKIVVLLDGAQVGMIRSVRANDDYSPEPASGIGDIHVQEWVPTMARHSISVSGMVLIRNNIQKTGVVPENGDFVLQGMVFDFEVYGKDDGALLRKYVGASFASGDVDIQAHQILVTSAQFNCLDVVGTGT